MKQLIKIDAPELQVIEKSKAEQIRRTFEPMVEMLTEFETAYNEIVNESQKEITKELTRKAKEDAEKARLKAERAPDKKKLIVFADSIDQLRCLEVGNKYAKEIENNAMGLLAKVSRYIRDKAAEL